LNLNESLARLNKYSENIKGKIVSEYQPIENYGVIGDLNTVALVGLNGSIDFMCFPFFDSPTIFASLLDINNGGCFQINPKLDDCKNKQLYIPDTNVLLTRFLSKSGISELIDFMPVEDLYEGKILMRRITNIKGELTYRMNCRPRFNYARSKHKANMHNNSILFESGGEDKTILRLKSSVPIEIKNGDGLAEFSLNAGESADFILELVKDGNIPQYNISDMVTNKLYETMNYWKNWIDASHYKGRWRETVNRSALVLKLLTSYDHGSIIASPTFGLPESIGGPRNWDYRYTWIRDASFTVYTFLSLGYTKEAEQFMKWVEKQCEDIGEAGNLGLMYTISGKGVPDEVTLSNLEGYKKSSPVRIGNDANNQLQLDIYGEMMDSVYLFNKYGNRISHDFWSDISQQINWVATNWDQKDQGIWEVRGGKRNFLYSRFMCWVALDRAVRLAEMSSFPYPSKWKEERDKIYSDIYKAFWNEKRKAFVQYKDADSVDAATLLMPIIRFVSPKDPRWLTTLKAIEKDLVSDSLVYRYRFKEAAADGLKTGEGTFSMCTFWYIECLSGAGQLQKARLYFEKMLGYSNHLGLFSEQLGEQGEALGNYPQAFTHLGLISAALNLDKQLSDERNRGNSEDYRQFYY
jgi:GH15 family glucan-1,4-alpha-glucosidase